MIYTIFKKALALNPHDIALVNSQGTAYTWQEVDIKIRQLARYFFEEGIGHNSRVALVTKNEDLHFLVYLALNFLQATYIPFDMDTPEQDIADSIAFLNLATFLNDDAFSEDMFACAPLEADFYQYQKHISYILSSSGSTGAKKWIPIDSDGLSHWTGVIKETLTEKQRVLCTRSPAFDARIFEYLLAIATQGSLYLLDAVDRKSMDSVIESCKKYAITSILLIASQLNHNRQEEFLLTLKNSGLTHLLVTGDACSPQLVKYCEQLAINVLNCYGPTEATFGLSMLCVNGLVTDGMPVPIGLPTLPVKIHLHEDELYIESPYLSTGYLGTNQDKNATAFPVINEVRVFRTGDRFSFLPNGLLAFHGRISEESHVKISGVKIFPDFIQEQIKLYKAEHLDCVVVIKSWLGKDKPFAYIQSYNPINKEEFKIYLKKTLRKEAWPIVILLDKLPRLINEKIDRQNLIYRKDLPETFFFHEQERFTEKLFFQEELTSIWLELFNINSIHPEDDFLCLGGDSKLATELTEKIQKIAPDFLYRDLLTLPDISIKSLSNYLEKNVKATPEHALINNLYPIDGNKENVFLLPALLGEGYFSYKHLASHLARIWNVNIYGMTDPGIFDEKRLPDSLEEAARRYLEAIKRIQPNGPYRLGGFSYGCTLAYKVASLLESQGETVEQLHLFDGFPPLLYQKLTPEGHASLLLSLVHFIRETLNNRYYKQTIEKTIYKGLEELGRIDQISIVLSHLISEVKSGAHEAELLLKIARRHLYFMQEDSLPLKKLKVCPELYLTDNSQPYLKVIKAINDLPRDSRDFHFFYWNNYFKKMKRNPVELKIKHNELLQADLSSEVHQYFQYKPSPRAFFHSAPSHFSTPQKRKAECNTAQEKAFLNAASENNLSKLKKLMSSVNINVQDEFGRTALHYAVIKNSTKCLGFLLNLKAINPRIMDNQGKMAVDYTECLFKAVIEELNLPKPVADNALKYQLFKPSTPHPIELLLKAYNLPDQSQQSIARGIKQAAIENNRKELQEFISLIKNINAIDHLQRTALHWAALFGNMDCFSILLNHGALANLRDCHYRTAKEYVVPS